MAGDLPGGCARMVASSAHTGQTQERKLASCVWYRDLLLVMWATSHDRHRSVPPRPPMVRHTGSMRIRALSVFEGVVYHCWPVDRSNPGRPTLEVDAVLRP